MGADIILLCYIKSGGDSSPLKIGITQENALKSDISLSHPDMILELKVKSGFTLSKKHIQYNYQIGYNKTCEFLRM